MPGDTEQSATANLSPFFSLSEITNQKAGTMPPEDEQPKADDPTTPTTPATVEPTGNEGQQEVVQDQVVTETHVEERPASDDEDSVSDDEDAKSEEE